MLAMWLHGALILNPPPPPRHGCTLLMQTCHDFLYRHRRGPRGQLPCCGSRCRARRRSGCQAMVLDGTRLRLRMPLLSRLEHSLRSWQWHQEARAALLAMAPTPSGTHVTPAPPHIHVSFLLFVPPPPPRGPAAGSGTRRPGVAVLSMAPTPSGTLLTPAPSHIHVPFLSLVPGTLPLLCGSVSPRSPQGLVCVGHARPAGQPLL